jgi:hypothetical protein
VFQEFEIRRQNGVSNSYKAENAIIKRNAAEKPLKKTDRFEKDILFASDLLSDPFCERYPILSKKRDPGLTWQDSSRKELFSVSSPSG